MPVPLATRQDSRPRARLPAPAPPPTSRPPRHFPAGPLYALDRRLPLAEFCNALARFQGNRLRLTRWLMRRAGPRFARLALASWRIPRSAVLGAGAPFLLCAARDPLREGV